MWYKALDNRELQRVHDTLSKAVFRLLDTVSKDGQPVPHWAEDAAADLRGMYDELWRRRNSANRFAKPEEGVDNAAAEA